MAGNKYNHQGKIEKEYVLLISENHKVTGTADQLIRKLIKIYKHLTQTNYAGIATKIKEFRKNPKKKFQKKRS
jgi:hypothetical protein